MMMMDTQRWYWRRCVFLLLVVATAVSAATMAPPVGAVKEPSVLLPAKSHQAGLHAVTIHPDDDAPTVGRQLQRPAATTAFAPTVYPTLTFTIRIGLAKPAATTTASDNNNNPPSSSSSADDETPTQEEMRALVCQLQRFLQQRLRDKTGDAGIVTLLHTIQWKTTTTTMTESNDNDYNNKNSNARLELNFTTQSFFSDQDAANNRVMMSPWTLIQHAELPREEMRGFIRNYLWTLKDTLFVRTRTLYFGGTLIMATNRNNQTTDASDEDRFGAPLDMALCPPAPPFPAGNNIFGHQTAVPVVEDFSTSEIYEYDSSSRLSNNSIGNTPPKEQPQQQQEQDATIGRNRLTLVVPFWIANDQGMNNLTRLQSQWLQPSWSLLVDHVVEDYRERHPLLVGGGARLPNVVPNSATVVQVIPMPCPIPTSSRNRKHPPQQPQHEWVWLCHHVTAGYDIAMQLVSIPMPIPPALYSYELERAIQSGVYQDVLLRVLATTTDTDNSNSSGRPIIIRIGNDRDALQPSWWKSEQSTASSRARSRRRILLGVAITSGVVLGILAMLLVAVAWFYQRKARILGTRRKDALWEMEALLMWPNSHNGRDDMTGNGKDYNEKQPQDQPWSSTGA